MMAVAIAALAIGCGGPPASPSPSASRPIDGVVLITIDTLRADRVGAYGWRAARTPAIDGLAARGVRAERAYATAPITLTSHASLLTGLYPPHHGARHNGMRLGPNIPTLAELLKARGFATGAFVAAFPLDRRFGLHRGFDVYSDALPRGADGRPRNERPGRDVVDEALVWLATHAASPFLLWVHLFEPHAPYEGEGASRSVSDRYDDEVARADAQVARVVRAVEPRAASTLVVVASDHGEAFGEHGELAHSIFVYDTTLRVPLVIAGAGGAGRVIAEPVSLVDIVPTMLDLLKHPAAETDGVSLAGALSGGALARRSIYAESFAPLLDFGWSPLRTVRDGDDKYIAAPKPELYDLARDPGETKNQLAERAPVGQTLAAQVERFSPPVLPIVKDDGTDLEALPRLRSLGYLAGSTRAPVARDASARPDPKDRIELAARIAEVTSGELQGAALRTALERLVRDDPRNGQMQMRLAYVLLEAGACREAVPHFGAAIEAGVPTAETYLGLGECLGALGRRDAARRALTAADRVEPGNPIVAANLGLMALEDNRVPDAIRYLRGALERTPELHQARFALARAYGRAGQRADAAREARELLARLPPNAPQRTEVERLLAALQ